MVTQLEMLGRRTQVWGCGLASSANVEAVNARGMTTGACLFFFVNRFSPGCLGTHSDLSASAS